MLTGTWDEIAIDISMKMQYNEKNTFSDIRDPNGSAQTIGEVWAMFAASDFANLSSYGDHGDVSELLAAYPVREKVMQRELKETKT